MCEGRTGRAAALLTKIENVATVLSKLNILNIIVTTVNLDEAGLYDPKNFGVFSLVVRFTSTNEQFCHDNKMQLVRRVLLQNTRNLNLIRVKGLYFQQKTAFVFIESEIKPMLSGFT